MKLRFTRLLVGTGLLGMLAVLPAQRAQAQFFSLPTNLSTTQTDAILKLMSADTAFRSVEGASAIGDTFGLSVGVVGVATLSSALNSVISGAATGFIPGGMIVATVQAPLGLALEIGFLPAFTLNSASFSNFGIGAKWTFSKFIPLLPLDAAVRLNFAFPRIQYTLTSPVATTMTYGSTTMGVSLMISKTFFVFEPFLGLSFYSASARLDTTATAYFATASSAVTSNATGLGFTGGIDFKFPILALSVQYENALGNDTVLARAGFRY